MSKLKLVLPAAFMIGMLSIISCKKTTNNTTVVQDSIYYSSWTQLNMTQSVPAAGDTLYTQQFTAPAITTGIISRGAVVGYFGYVSNSGDTVMYNEAEFGSIVAVSWTVGAIQVEGFNVDLSWNGGSGYLFRYVVIPGNVLTTSFNGMTQQQLGKMSFTDLQKAINNSKQTSGNTFNP